MELVMLLVLIACALVLGYAAINLLEWLVGDDRSNERKTPNGKYPNE